MGRSKKSTSFYLAIWNDFTLKTSVKSGAVILRFVVSEPEQNQQQNFSISLDKDPVEEIRASDTRIAVVASEKPLRNLLVTLVSLI
jgi:hypothetical protein